MPRYEIKSGDFKEEIELEDGPPKLEDVKEVVSKAVEENKNLSVLISVENVANPEKKIFFSSEEILDDLGLIKRKPIEVGEITITPGRAEILLTVLRENEWLNPADVYRSLEIDMGKEGAREAIKDMDSFLEIEDIGSEKQKRYRVRPKGDQQTFISLIDVFRHFDKFKTFLDTRYFSENKEYIRQYEELVEEEMEELKGETLPVVKEKEKLLDADSLSRKLSGGFIDSLERIQLSWNSVMDPWLLLEKICEDCSFQKECMDRKEEKYGNKILSEQLEKYKEQGIPSRIAMTYCATVSNSLFGLLNKLLSQFYQERYELAKKTLIFREDIESLLK